MGTNKFKFKITKLSFLLANAVREEASLKALLSLPSHGSQSLLRNQNNC